MYMDEGLTSGVWATCMESLSLKFRPFPYPWWDENPYGGLAANLWNSCLQHSCHFQNTMFCSSPLALWLLPFPWRLLCDVSETWVESVSDWWGSELYSFFFLQLNRLWFSVTAAIWDKKKLIYEGVSCTYLFIKDESFEDSYIAYQSEEWAEWQEVTRAAAVKLISVWLDLYPFTKGQLTSSTINLAFNSLMERLQALEENLKELTSLLNYVLFLKVFKKQNFIYGILYVISVSILIFLETLNSSWYPETVSSVKIPVSVDRGYCLNIQA